jgi:hypothetical protein
MVAMELVKGDPVWSEVARCGSRVRRKLREFLVERELTCALAGIISLGTRSYANNKGSPKEEVG